jgi:hypothetical protein
MTSEFDRLKDEARIDNYLAGTSQSPQRNTAKAGARPNGLSTNGPPAAGRTANDDATIPAAYETTGLLPRSGPSTSSSSTSSVKSTYSSKPDADRQESGSAMQR